MLFRSNIDAVHEAEKFGIDQSRAAQFHNDEKGIELNYQAVSEAIYEMRACGNISESWKKAIEADFEKRSK